MTALAITALSVRSSLGPSPGALAAARAGITRTHPLGLTYDDGENAPHEVVGHVVPALRPFSGLGRRLALGAPALRSLLADPLFPRRARAALVIVGASTQGSAHRLSAGEPTVRWVAATDIPTAPDALVQGLIEAERQLAVLATDVVVLGVIDSAADAPALEALEASGRLKSRDNPVGVIPGEAAVFLALTRDGHAGPTLARIDRWRCAPNYGGLADLGPRVGWLFSPLNGEEPIAREWSALVVRWRPEHTWHPAASFGDTLAAHGALAIAWATAAWGRRYARGTTTCALTTGPDGPRGAVWLSAPGASPGGRT